MVHAAEREQLSKNLDREDVKTQQKHCGVNAERALAPDCLRFGLALSTLEAEANER
ncbi:hypothetical protein [Marinimicrobium sp. LS-A18]|uniref:hypothetical protein n=1 Tax=Marinimicrobium sp. LS-A18 TaxID=1381596 RepID=UPI0004BC0561|nr:hypothetical protein [Marinimicrobium sp. LS-A18]